MSGMGAGQTEKQKGSRYDPPKAGFLPVASLRVFADAGHRHAKRAYPQGKQSRSNDSI
jgi:hypothetical protein